MHVVMVPACQMPVPAMPRPLAGSGRGLAEFRRYVWPLELTVKHPPSMSCMIGQPAKLTFRGPGGCGFFAATATASDDTRVALANPTVRNRFLMIFSSRLLSA